MNPTPSLPAERRRRPRPVGANRVLAAYLPLLAGVIALAVAYPLAYRASDRCDLDGFGCLGVFFGGMIIGGAIGLAAIVLISLVLRLGLVYLGCLALAVAAAVLTGLLLDDAGLTPLPAVVIGLLAAPAVAAWLSHPRNAELSADRYWLPRAGVIAVLTLLSLAGAILHS